MPEINMFLFESISMIIHFRFTKDVAKVYHTRLKYKLINDQYVLIHNDTGVWDMSLCHGINCFTGYFSREECVQLRNCC